MKPSSVSTFGLKIMKKMEPGNPDRLDGLVWAISDLALGKNFSPRIRGLKPMRI